MNSGVWAYQAPLPNINPMDRRTAAAEAENALAMDTPRITAPNAPSRSVDAYQIRERAVGPNYNDIKKTLNAYAAMSLLFMNYYHYLLAACDRFGYGLGCDEIGLSRFRVGAEPQPSGGDQLGINFGNCLSPNNPQHFLRPLSKGGLAIGHFRRRESLP